MILFFILNQKIKQSHEVTGLCMVQISKGILSFTIGALKCETFHPFTRLLLILDLLLLLF